MANKKITTDSGINIEPCYNYSHLYNGVAPTAYAEK
ncbi:MAG: hypothetical protein RLZZ316_1907, partial [Bacteroidota bacterium]